jgi:hypothetical protein
MRPELLTTRGLVLLEALLTNDGQTLTGLWSALAQKPPFAAPGEAADFELHVVPNLQRTGLVQRSRERLWLVDAEQARAAAAERHRRDGERALKVAGKRSRAGALAAK